MSTVRTRRSRAGSPAWEIARIFPNQGHWTEGDFLCLETNQLVELSEGFIEVLPMPTTWHQMIVAALFQALDAFIKPFKLGTVLFAALPVRLWEDKIREPDVVFMLAKNSHRIHELYWEGADLVMEVVSRDPEGRKRDLKEKRSDYAKARIPEYWIIDPRKGLITVLTLRGKKYIVAGEYGPGSKAKSVLLHGFEVDVKEVLAVGTANGRKK